jgi:phosphate:Na+ symporter
MPLEDIALILGANIGTCGSWCWPPSAKHRGSQVGIVHLLFNVLGVLSDIPHPQLANLVRHISPSYPDFAGLARLAAETPRQVANTHTLFSVASTLILIWFTGPISKLAQLIVPARQKETKRAGDPLYLDDHP